MKRFVIILFVILCLFHFSPYSHLVSATSVSILEFSVNPPVVSSNAYFEIRFKMNVSLAKGEGVYIRFPEKFYIPYTIALQSVVVGIQGKNPSEIVVQDNVVRFVLSDYLSKYDNYTDPEEGIPLEIYSSAGIKTSSESGLYDFYIWTDEEPQPVQYGVYIGEEGEENGTQVEHLKIELTENSANKLSEYKISFMNSPNSYLDFSRDDYVDIVFPKEMELPEKPEAKFVILNLGTSSKVEIDIEKNKLRVYLPEMWFVLFGAECNLIIREEFGVRNPEFAGDYYIQLSTSRDRKTTFCKFSVTSNQVSLYSLKLTPNNQGFRTALEMEFRTSSLGQLSAGEGQILVKFAQEFTVPQIQPEHISISIGNRSYKPKSASVIDNLLAIITPVSIEKDTYVNVEIGIEAGIINPKKMGQYVVSVATSSDAKLVPYNIEIYKSYISSVNVAFSNDAESQAGVIYLHFLVGAGGALKAGVDAINIYFPQEFTIPSAISAQWVLVNGERASKVEIQNRTVAVYVPNDIAAETVVSVEITRESGILNPSEEKEYCIEVCTTGEPIKVSSNRFLIKSVPTVNLDLMPESPNGLNGFYKTKPQIRLSASSSVDTNPLIYYFFDSSDPSAYTGAAIIPPEGIHTLYYYALDKEGHKSETYSLIVKIDTIPPIVTVISPRDNSTLNNTVVVVRGNVDIGSAVEVNETQVDLDEVGNFEVNIKVDNNPGTITVFAIDAAGNTSQVSLNVSFDATPPLLTVIKPVMFQQVSKLPLIVEGKTEVGASITINGNPGTVSEDGSFAFSVQSLQEGALSTIEVIATDAAGNSIRRTVSVKYSKSIVMKLQVGNKTALINNETSLLEAAPVIKDNRTMVPLRFIGEAFGAEFSYDPVFKIIDVTFGSDKIKMQIGKKGVFVNEMEMALDVAPFIVNGRTLVPIRFISETFGANVIWDGTTKTITVIYPKS